MSLEPYIGEIKLFSFGFAPKNYNLCAGQILSIANNSALFALLGTTYGGNGQTTFALPDLRGRFPISQGTGAGLPSHTIGERSGMSSVTLLSSNLPAHQHGLTSMKVNITANNTVNESPTPESMVPGTNNSSLYFATTATAGVTMAPGVVQISGTTGIAGNNMPISIANPYLVMNYSIALYGIFPSRN
ncbi:MAG: tail fiber protein [Bacteroidia bacterium]|jgi:microcystin-dependent protein|nr:tail fiber protein [Bacteroidia bacterium]